MKATEAIDLVLVLLSHFLLFAYFGLLFARELCVSALPLKAGQTVTDLPFVSITSLLVYDSTMVFV